MLVLLPIFILLISALAILIIQWIRPAFGLTWLIAALSATGSWGVLLAYHWRPPEPFVVDNWIPVQGVISRLSFEIDNNSWPYAISLAALVVGVVLTAGARLQQRSNPIVWAGSLVITSLGLLSAFSATPLALLLAWSAIDLFELGIMLGAMPHRTGTSVVQGSRVNQQAVIAFSARTAGSILVIFTMAFSFFQNGPLGFDTVPPGASIFLLIAAGLRLGVLPLHLPYPQEVLMRRGLGTMLRLVAPASSLVLLSRLPASGIPQAWVPFLIAFTILAVIYGGIMWLTSEDEIKGRPYWIIALAGMAVTCVILGKPSASLGWGVALLLSGGGLFLFSARRTRILYIPALGVLGLTGLPFTPAASSWTGLFSLPFSILNVIYLAAVALLSIGYVRHALRAEEPLETKDRWVQVVYPFGLTVVVGTAWITGILGWPGSFTIGIWWGSLAAAFLSASGWIWMRYSTRFRFASARPQAWFVQLIQKSRHSLAAFFRLDWFYLLSGLAFKFLQRIIQLITTILEGDGGVLWVLLLLTLLVTMIQAGTKP